MCHTDDSTVVEPRPLYVYLSTVGIGQFAVFFDTRLEKSWGAHWK